MDNIKVLIISDLEGVSGLYDMSDKENNTRLFTDELCVIIDTLLSIAINEIVVCDAHDNGDTLDKSVIRSKRVSVVSKFWNIDMTKKYDIAFLTGFHGMRGSGGIFPHTFRDDILRVTINGLFAAGEIEVFMRWLAYHGIPVVFVSGDNAAAMEAVYTDPKVTSCIVKTSGLKNYISVNEAYKIINTNIKNAISNKSCSLSYGIDSNIYVELINEDIYSELSDKWMITEKGLFFRTYDDFIYNINHLCKELNYADRVVINRSRRFIEKIKPLFSRYLERELMNSVIAPQLKKNLIELTKKDQSILMSYIRNSLEKTNEDN